MTAAASELGEAVVVNPKDIPEIINLATQADAIGLVEGMAVDDPKGPCPG